jgi:hypothetical protein
MAICVFLGAQVKIAHAEIIEKADIGFMQGIPHVGIADHGLAIDSASTFARLFDLLRSSFHFGLEGSEGLINGDHVPLWQSPGSIDKTRIIGLERKRMESVRRISAFGTGRDIQNGRGFAEIVKPERDDGTRLDWGRAISIKPAIENVSAVCGEGLLHFIELALHDRQLPAENHGADYAGGSYNAGQEDHPSVAAINAIYKRLGGYACILFVFIFCIIGMMFLMAHDRWSRLSSRASLLIGSIFMAASVALAGKGIALIFS